MDTTYRLISNGDLELIQTFLARSIHFCTEARPTTEIDDCEHAEPTEFYSGACGYARGTMTSVSQMLKNLPIAD